VHKSVDPQRLQAFISSTGLSYRNGSSAYIFTCPRCEKKEKLWIRRSDGVFRCWACAESTRFKGRPEYALAELLKRPVGEIQSVLYDFAELDESFNLTIDLRDPWDDAVENDIIEDETFTEVAYPLDYCPILHKNAEKGLLYLESRGITSKIAAKYDMYYATTKRRVCFPVKVGETLVGWQERLILPNKYYDKKTQKIVEVPKILSSPGLSGVRDRVVMFQNNLIGSPHAIICEGPIDAIKANYCGGAIATMGKAISQKQIQLIKNLGVSKIYLGLDPDAADTTAKLVSDFISDVEVYQIETGDKEDLGEMDFVQVYEAFLNAKKLTGGEVFIYIKDYY
jgi:hypothetical protein